MRRSTPALIAVVAAGFLGVVACGSSTVGPANVSLAGNYTLTSFNEGGVDVMPGVSSGVLALTDSAYAVDIEFVGNVQAAIVDSGTYVATDSGSFTETSRLNGVQLSGSYTFANNLLTVTGTVAAVPVTQGWQKQ
jgi:hypothetical protein